MHRAQPPNLNTRAADSHVPGLREDLWQRARTRRTTRHEVSLHFTLHLAPGTDATRPQQQVPANSMDITIAIKEQRIHTGPRSSKTKNNSHTKRLAHSRRHGGRKDVLCAYSPHTSIADVSSCSFALANDLHHLFKSARSQCAVHPLRIRCVFTMCGLTSPESNP